MLPYKRLIDLDPSLRTPLYLQITNAFIRNISAGVLATGLKIPGSRKMSSLLAVNRRTVITAYEELAAQGWLEILPNSGAFVNKNLPIRTPRALDAPPVHEEHAVDAFKLRTDLDFLEHYTPRSIAGIRYVIDTGYPDVRIGPLKEITSTLNGLLKGKLARKMMNYSPDFLGDQVLREELASYLMETRCIQAKPDNIMLVRGSLNAFYCLFQVLLNPDDIVIVGEVSFKVANKIIGLARGKLQTVPVDDKGINVDAIEQICQKRKIKAVFVMPHHHHPTTVTLSAERRMKLLMLAQQYQFAIIEDDYDYDFHYAKNPILPMASSDRTGVVAYVGSLSKTVAPGLRTGFLVAPDHVISDVSRMSRFIDCHGNPALERAIALLFKEGIIRRHLKKALRIYHERRDHFCSLLTQELGAYTTFSRPNGGLAAWVHFDERLPLKQIHEDARKKGLLISDTVFYKDDGELINAIRMGFASLSPEETTQALSILKEVIQKRL